MTEPARPTYDGLAEARRLLRSIRAATLATLQPAGFPLATLTTIATDFDGTPILLLSQLSAHTRNLDSDGRCSLLLSQGGKGDPLAHPRLSLVGKAHKITEPVQRKILRARFLNRNPKAALYADFGDFSFWRVETAMAHLNGGFAKAADYEGTILASAVPEGLPAIEPGLLERLNGAGRDNLGAKAKAAGGADLPWKATGVDSGGIDLAAREHIWRLDFEAQVTELDELKQRIEKF